MPNERDTLIAERGHVPHSGEHVQRRLVEVRGVAIVDPQRRDAAPRKAHREVAVEAVRRAIEPASRAPSPDDPHASLIAGAMQDAGDVATRRVERQPIAGLAVQSENVVSPEQFD